MELKILLAAELDGEAWKGNVITLDLDPEGLASAEELVTKLHNYVVANIHHIEGVRSHVVTSELRHDEMKDLTFRVEATVRVLLNGKEVV